MYVREIYHSEYLLG